MKISNGAPFAKGELGKRDLSLRIGDMTRSASSDDTAPDLICAAKRALSARVKPSRRCVKEVLRVGTMSDVNDQSEEGVRRT